MFKTRSFDRIIRLSPRESEKNVLSSRLQNSRFFFLKISKEIGKAWRKSLKREAREPHTPVRRVRREKKPSISIASLWNVVYKVEDQKWVEVAVRQQSLCLFLEEGVSRKSRALRINCRLSKHSSAILWVDVDACHDLSVWNISNKRPKFTFAQSKRFPPKRNLLDKENNYFGMS